MPFLCFVGSFVFLVSSLNDNLKVQGKDALVSFVKISIDFPLGRYLGKYFSLVENNESTSEVFFKHIPKGEFPFVL